MGRLCGPPLLSELMSICMYMLIKCVCTVHVRTLLSSCEALIRVSSKLGASISSTPSSRRLSMGKNTLEGRGKGGEGEGRGGEGREEWGGEGMGGDGSRTLVTATVMTRILAIVLARAICLQSVAPKHTQLQHNAIPDQVDHHRPPSTHTPPPTNVHYHPPTYPHPPQ